MNSWSGWFFFHSLSAPLQKKINLWPLPSPSSLVLHFKPHGCYQNCSSGLLMWCCERYLTPSWYLSPALPPCGSALKEEKHCTAKNGTDSKMYFIHLKEGTPKKEIWSVRCVLNIFGALAFRQQHNTVRFIQAHIKRPPNQSPFSPRIRFSSPKFTQRTFNVVPAASDFAGRHFLPPCYRLQNKIYCNMSELVFYLNPTLLPTDSRRVESYCRLFLEQKVTGAFSLICVQLFIYLFFFCDGQHAIRTAAGV